MENMLKVRIAIAILSVLMVMFGVGSAISIALGYNAIHVVDGGLLGLHGFALIIPGLIGAFIWCECGCCHSRAAYITSAVFDSLSIVALISCVGIFSDVFVSEWLRLSYCTWTVDGQCTCSNSFYFRSSWYPPGTVMCSQAYDSGVALISMWTFGTMAIIAHFVLVIYMACVLKPSTVSPAVMIFAPAGENILVTMAQKTYMAQGHGFPVNTQPTQVQPAWVQPGLVHSGFAGPGYGAPGYGQTSASYGQAALGPMGYGQPGGFAPHQQLSQGPNQLPQGAGSVQIVGDNLQPLQQQEN